MATCNRPSKIKSNPFATTAGTTGVPAKLWIATSKASAMLRLLVPRPTTSRAARSGPPIIQPSASDASANSAITSNGPQPMASTERSSVIVTKASDTAPVNSEMISTGRNARRPSAGARWFTVKPTPKGSVIVANNVRRIPLALNLTMPASGTAFNATSHTQGVRKTEIIGNSEVNPTASARSARAIRANTGTTGANGAAARRIIPMESSAPIPKILVAATTSAGTTAKFTTTISASRHFRTDSTTCPTVSLRPAPSNRPDNEPMVSTRMTVSVFINTSQEAEFGGPWRTTRRESRRGPQAVKGNPRSLVGPHPGV